MDIKDSGSPTDHLANERTFLAWVRTSLGIMAFGFVVVKFSLFVKQLSIIVGKEGVSGSEVPASGAGISIIVMAALITLISYFRYRTIESGLNNGRYGKSSTPVTIMLLLILLISLFVVWYLVVST